MTINETWLPARSRALPTYTKDPSMTEDGEKAAVLFHRLWTQSVGTEGYVKAHWVELSALLSKFGLYV